MPIYIYKCEKCKNEHEIFQKSVKEFKETIICDQDGCDGIMKLKPTKTTVKFKGKGFYETDYKKQTPSSKK